MAQKRLERFFVEEAIRSLGVSWTIHEELDPPDFIIADGTHHFGLDVADIFGGAQNVSGSVMKRAESDTQKQLNNLLRQYENQTGVSLCVKFLGRITPDALARVVPELVARNLAVESIGYQTTLEILVGFEAPMKLYVTKSYRSDWFAMNDRIGFVMPNPDSFIAGEIAKKSKKLAKYKSRVGDDVRLLLVANGVQNSGKIGHNTDSAFDFHGFKAVYFFPYPEKALVLREATYS
ncbi:MAG: hypothetical protein U1E25_08300 [Methylocystis sp.]